MSIYRSIFLFISFLAAFPLYAAAPAKAAVTYPVINGSRFGDHLLSYMHAKWFSYAYRIPVHYRPFEYSKYLKLHKIEKTFPEKSFSQKAKIQVGVPLQINRSILYTARYFPESLYNLKYRNSLDNGKYTHFYVPWEKAEFRQILKNAIQPIEPLETIRPPQDRLSVALHIRTGGSYAKDTQATKDLHKNKFLPLSYYITQVKNLCDLTVGIPLHIHLFTDATDPHALLDTIAEPFPDRDIQWVTRTGSNNHNLNVLEDFFSLFNFDCLVRSESNFSVVPGLLQEYAIEIFPDCYEERPRDSQKFREVIHINRPLLDNLRKKILF